MVIIYNLIALGIVLVALAVAFVIGRFIGVAETDKLLLIGAPIAVVLDLFYRARTGRLFHPRGGGALFFIPVWVLGLFVLPKTAATFFGVHAQLPKELPSLAAILQPPSLGSSPSSGPSSNRITSEAEGKREALRLYPALGVANSPLNLEFIRRYRQYQQERPEFFRDPAWPVALVNECAAPLGIQPSPR